MSALRWIKMAAYWPDDGNGGLRAAFSQRRPHRASFSWATGDCVAALEDLVGVADVAGAADVGQGEVELVTIVVTRRTQLVFAVFHADAAAVPVVGGQDLAVLHASQVDRSEEH